MSVHAAVALDLVGDVMAVALVLGCMMQLLTLLGLLRGGDDDGSDSDGGGGGGGGGGDRPPDRPSGGGSHVEPAWWAQFEQDFAEYSRASHRDCVAGAGRPAFAPVRRGPGRPAVRTCP